VYVLGDIFLENPGTFEIETPTDDVKYKEYIVLYQGEEIYDLRTIPNGKRRIVKPKWFQHMSDALMWINIQPDIIVGLYQLNPVTYKKVWVEGN